MAFIFVVEDGSADPDANSYADQDFAIDYITSNVNQGEAFLAADDETQQYHLVRASRYLDQTVVWYGKRVDRESGLRWPRAGVYDQDGFEIPDDEIPIDLQYATCELATYLANGDDYTNPQGIQGFKQIEVDVINLRMNDDYVRQSIPTTIIDMVSALGAVQSGIKPQFRKIKRV